MELDTVALIVIGLVVFAILFWVVKKAAQEAYLFWVVKRAAQKAARQDRQQIVQEANSLLKELNKAFFQRGQARQASWSMDNIAL
jgi:hypothetical protein